MTLTAGRRDGAEKNRMTLAKYAKTAKVQNSFAFGFSALRLCVAARVFRLVSSM
jgi:hypothetical protein